MRARRPEITLVILALTLGLYLATAATALAADGVRVVPSPEPTPYVGEFEPAISGGYVAFTSTNPADSDDSVICLKFLGDGSPAEIVGDRPASGFKDAEPAILADSGTIYVVWSRIRLSDPWDIHLMIWKGTYGASPASGTPRFLADLGYPRVLVEGPAGTPAPWQTSPAIGLADVPGGQHVVVAWEDSRETAPQVPMVYWLDLTEDPTPDPATAGNAADATYFLGRGQHLPAVGAGGIYWLDERLSWWMDGNLTDTAVWRLNLATGDAAAYFTDSDHDYDNGVETGPQVTYNGAMWLRSGPYGGGAPPDAFKMPFIKPAGGSGRTVGPIVQPIDPATFTRSGATNTGLAVGGKHGDSAAAEDFDVFFFDVNTGERTAVCDRSVTATDPTHAYRGNQFSPAIGNATWAYRVVWVDQRDSAAEDSPDAKLYEAFVPTIRWTLRPSAILNLSTLRASVTVEPDFSGEPVYLQRLSRSLSKGAVVYKPYRAALAKATMVPGPTPNTSSSVGALRWKPTVKGTYYLRVWFPGAARYTYDGITVASAKQVAVPHVGNYGKVFKLVVK